MPQAVNNRDGQPLDVDIVVNEIFDDGDEVFVEYSNGPVPYKVRHVLRSVRAGGRVRAGAGRAGGCGRAGPAHTAPHRTAAHTSPMSELRRSDRKRTQTQFFEATETLGRKTKESQLSACRAHAAAVASAYYPLGGLVQLGEVEGAEGCVWAGTEDSPALGGGCWCVCGCGCRCGRVRARVAALREVGAPLRSHSTRFC